MPKSWKNIDCSNRKKPEQNILDEIRNRSWDTGRIRIDDAEKIARSYKEHLEKARGAIELTIAGSLRRLELNAHPRRLDLDGTGCRRGREMGIKVAISTDACGIENLEHMRFGVGQSRRGWLGPEDILNPCEWMDLKKLLKRT